MESVKKKKRNFRRKESELLLKKYRESGLTQREWCEQEGINLSALRYWVKRASREKQKCALVPIEVRRPEKLCSLKLEVSGIRIQVEEGSDPVLLAKVLRELR